MDGTILKCDLCDYVIQFYEKHQKGLINQHLQSSRHQNLLLESDSRSKQPFIVDEIRNSEKASKAAKKFELDLAQAFIHSSY